MKTTLSTKGQIVVPLDVRQALRIEAGDALDIRIEAGSIVLTPINEFHEGAIVNDPLTGFPVLTFGGDAPLLTSEEVAEILRDFP